MHGMGGLSLVIAAIVGAMMPCPRPTARSIDTENPFQPAGADTVSDARRTIMIDADDPFDALGWEPHAVVAPCSHAPRDLDVEVPFGASPSADATPLPF